MVQALDFNVPDVDQIKTNFFIDAECTFSFVYQLIVGIGSPVVNGLTISNRHKNIIQKKEETLPEFPSKTFFRRQTIECQNFGNAYLMIMILSNSRRMLEMARFGNSIATDR